MSIAERLQGVRARIEAATLRRPPELAEVPVRLLAVSKRQPVEAIREAVAAGQRDFAENYAQEFHDKAEALAELPIDWHFIGHLQSNKIKLVLGRALLHTVDRGSLVDKLDKRAERVDERVPLLVEVNNGEPQKAGVAPDELPALLDAVSKSRHLCCVGLMIMAPAGTPEQARPHFRGLRQLRDTQAQIVRPHVELRELSMGMSADFEVAVEEGATLVRVGSAIFGPRPAAQPASG